MAKPQRRWLLWPLLLVPLAGAVLWTVGGAVFSQREREALPKDDPTTAVDPSAVVVTAAPVAFQPVQRTVEAVGTLAAYEEVPLAAKVEGRVRKVLHDVADRVPPGELLIEIDPTDYDLSVRQAERAVQVELAKLGLTELPAPSYDVSDIPSVKQADARRENAKLRLERSRMLIQRQANSSEELADRSADFRMAQAEYDNQLLQARTGLMAIQLKQESLAIAQQQRRDTEVRAPKPTQPVPGAESGATYAISQRAVAEGSYVRAGAEVCKVLIEQTLKLRVSVPEAHSAAIRVGQQANVFTAAHARPFTGTVGRINPAVDATTRTFEVEILVPNRQCELKPGSFAKTAIHTRLDRETATVPLEALVSFAGVTKVFLIENGHVREVPVTLGVQSTTWVEIVSPELPRDARVVTSGQSVLATGAAVTIRR
jgi:RND family efflux transporter MFP subunit